jgi:hypothetical protein
VAKTGGLLGLIVLTAVAAMLAAATPARAGNGSLLGCGDTSTQPFMRFLDPLPYTLAPDGGFEGGAEGWTLSGGARVVSGNEPFGLSAGSRSLSLPERSSATSPPMCVGLLLPIVRFAATGGELLGSLKVEVLYTNVFGGRSSIELLPGALPSGSKWAPTLPLLQLGGLVNAVTLNGLTTDVQFRFTPRGLFGGGNWRIDSVYVDPWKGS